MSQTQFQPIRALKDGLEEVTIQDGNFIITADTKEIYADIGYEIDETLQTSRIKLNTGQSIQGGGEIFNDYENNKAYGPYSSTSGQNNTSGTSMYRIKMLLDRVPVDAHPNLEEGQSISNCFVLNIVDGLEIGMTCSCQISNCYDFFGTIIEFTSEGVRFDNYIIYDKKYEPTLDESTWGTLWVPSTQDSSNANLGDGETFGGTGAFASGYNNKAESTGAASFGANNVASGKYSFTSGKGNTAAWAAACFGNDGQATGQRSLTQGDKNTASGYASRAMGKNNKATANSATAIGDNAQATANIATAIGSYTKAQGWASMAVNEWTEANGAYSFAGGVNTIANGSGSMAFGSSINDANNKPVTKTTADGACSLAFGKGVRTGAEGAVAFGYNTLASGRMSFTAGQTNTVSGDYSAAFGYNNEISGSNSFIAGGNLNKITANNSMATGEENTINSIYSFAAGRSNIISEGHPECFAFGYSNEFTEKAKTAMAVGHNNSIRNLYGFAAGYNSEVSGEGGMALGIGCWAGYKGQIAVGQWTNTGNNKALFMVGNGTDEDHRSNAFEILGPDDKGTEIRLTLGGVTLTKSQLEGLIRLLEQ